MSNIWHLGDLPFLINTNPVPTNHPLPDVLPFSVTYDEGTGLIRQTKNSVTQTLLRRAYQKGSMLTGFMTESGIGLEYADDFSSFLVDEVGKENIETSKVLEIGCGTGYLLSQLKQLGARVMGLEPGVQRTEGERKYDLFILDDFFPTPKIYDFGPFDLIVQYGVLEHIEDIGLFLDRQKEILSPSGLIALAIPHCEPYIDSGDISMFIHEHYSYFTMQSLRLVLSANGFEPIVLQRSRFGGAIYCIARKGTSYQPSPQRRSLFSLFVARARANIHKFKEVVSTWQANEGVVGIYCPGRAINLLHQSNITEGLRFFNDNELLHGRYYPGFSIPVESFDRLEASPVKNVLIMSRSFAGKIAAKVRRVKGVNVHVLSELLY